MATRQSNRSRMGASQRGQSSTTNKKKNTRGSSSKSWKLERASVSRKSKTKARSNKYSKTSDADTKRKPAPGTRARTWVGGHERKGNQPVRGHYRKLTPDNRKPASSRKASNGGNGNGKAQTTTDHEEIRRWVEERNGKPAMVRNTVRNTERRTDEREEAGILRIDFPGHTGEETLEPLSWDEFFEKFDRENLAFLYQEETKEGKTSRFSKFIRRQE